MVMLVNFLEVLVLITPILANKYDFTFNRLEIEPNPNKIANVEISLKKKGASVFLLSGVLKQLTKLDNKYEMQISLHYDADQSGILSNVATLPKVGICEVMKTLYRKYIYQLLRKSCSNAPSPDQCPLPPKKYYVKNMRIDLNKYSDIFLAGFYEFRIEVFKGNKLQAKFSVFGSTKQIW